MSVGVTFGEDAGADRRAQEYLRGSIRSASRHRQFFVEKVRAWAEAELGVTASREGRGIFGVSNGAAFAAAWPTVAGQQQMGMHLDIAVDNLGDGPDRRTRFLELLDDAVARGAQVGDHQPQEHRVVVMLDPAGNRSACLPGETDHRRAIRERR